MPPTNPSVNERLGIIETNVKNIAKNVETLMNNSDERTKICTIHSEVLARLSTRMDNAEDNLKALWANINAKTNDSFGWMKAIILMVAASGLTILATHLYNASSFCPK